MDQVAINTKEIKQIKQNQVRIMSLINKLLKMFNEGGDDNENKA